MLEQTAFPEISFWESNFSADVRETLLPNEDKHEEWEYIMSHLTRLKRGIWSCLHNRDLFLLQRAKCFDEQSRLGILVEETGLLHVQ